jgi:3-oxoacyl-[acyl-carrier protein] reductase
MGRLEGKIAMVTGAGGEHGLGRAIAQRFADEGADLILTDVVATGLRVSSATPPGAWGGVDAVADEIRKRGRRAMIAIADVRSTAQMEKVVTSALAEFGRIDILVNNAGAPGSLDRTLVVDLPEEAWDTVLDTNLKGTFITSQAVARSMLERRVRGRIISMSSQWGKKGGARRAAYCASKFGIIGFTQSLAQELAPAGITVNAICPSAAETERLDHMGLRADGTFDPGQRAERIKQTAAATPLGRIARPSDVAEVAAFLAGDAAEYITG